MARGPHAVLAAVLLLSAGSAAATTVKPMKLDELRAGAGLVFRGRVIAMTPVERSGPEGRPRVIRTSITFAVERVLKGEAGDEVTLTMLGGRIGDRALYVAGAPRFVIGQRAVVFASLDRSAFVPTVGIAQGVFRIVPDPATGADVIDPNDVRRLHRAEAQRAGARNARARFETKGGPLSLADFEEQIHD